MELKDFIQKSLLSIVSGVKDANESENRFGLNGEYHARKQVNGQFVHFDVSVIASEAQGEESKKGLGIMIANAFIGASKETDQTQSNQIEHRLRFSVFIKDE
ncbi:MAG: hypothetical protein KKA90_03990 [Nanoarchaeota archaeon]|nr:hypothetical protein [Nanoarchaeota archaeon]